MGGGVFHLQPRDLQAEKILAKDKNNPYISMNLIRTCLKSMFDSSRTYGLFTAYFDEELYRYAANYYDAHVFSTIDYIIGVIGVTRVLEDVEISQRNHLPYQDFKRFLEQDFCQIGADNNLEIINKFRRYFTAKIYVLINKKMEEEPIQILSVSDKKAMLSKPEWWQRNGTCHMIDSYTGKVEIVAKAVVEGQVKIRLGGPYIQNPEDKSKLIPYWIDYTKLTINEKTLFDTLTPAWHNKAYEYTMNAKADEEIKIHVEWLPHRSDT